MELQQLSRMILEGESNTLEFKKSSANLKKIAETLCAFLNGKGGTVLIGITDKGNIVGQHITDHTKQEIASILRKFEPSANIEIQYVLYKDNKHVIILSAHPDVHFIPYTFDGKAYERNESSTSIMTQGRYQQLLMSKSLSPISWESQPAIGVTLDDLDQSEILNTLNDITRKKRLEANLATDDITDILKKLKLIESENITNAAVVLFTKEIPGNYLQCVIRMARFRGEEKGTFIDSKHIFGNAFQILREAEAFINRNTAIASHFESGKFERLDEPEYPFEAIREALINAICHREYASPSGSITLTIYDDRLEIANTGKLPADITLSDLKIPHISHPRNPRITNVFFRRGYIESMGIGTQEIIRSCALANLKEPDFYEQAGAFIVRLWSKHYSAPSIMKAQLNNRQKEILTLLQPGALSPQEILSKLQEKISDRTLRRELQNLKKIGYVRNEGQGKKLKWFLQPGHNPDITRT